MRNLKVYLGIEVKFTGVGGLLLGTYMIDVVPRKGEIVALGDDSARYVVNFVFHNPNVNYVECLVTSVPLSLIKRLKQYLSKY